MRQPTGTYPAYPAQNPDSKPGAPPSNNLYGGQSSPNLYNPPSTGSLYSAPSHNSLFAPPPTNEKQQAGGQGQQYYQQSGNKGSVGGLGGSSWGLGTNDPEAGLDADIFDQQQRRRGSMLQVFGNELKKSWASLGNLTAQAANVIIGNPLSRTNSSHGSLHGSGYANRQKYDEEAGPQSPVDNNINNPPSNSNMASGLFSYLSSPRGSSSDQHILPRHSQQQKAASRRQSILP